MEHLESLRYPSLQYGHSTAFKELAVEPLEQVLGEQEDLTANECVVYLVTRLWLKGLSNDDEVFVDDKNKVWGKLPASLLTQRLQRQFRVTLQEKTVQRALRSLAAKGLLTRLAAEKKRYNRSYYYRLTSETPAGTGKPVANN